MSDISAKKIIIDKYLSNNEILGSNGKKPCSNIDLIIVIAYVRNSHYGKVQKYEQGKIVVMSPSRAGSSQSSS